MGGPALYMKAQKEAALAQVGSACNALPACRAWLAALLHGWAGPVLKGADGGGARTGARARACFIPDACCKRTCARVVKLARRTQLPQPSPLPNNKAERCTDPLEASHPTVLPIDGLVLILSCHVLPCVAS